MELRLLIPWAFKKERGKKITEFGKVVPKQPCDLSMQPRALEFGIQF